MTAAARGYKTIADHRVLHGEEGESLLQAEHNSRCVKRAASTFSVILTSPLLSNAIYLVGVQGLNAALGFAFWVLAARKLASQDLGTIGATMSLVSLLSSTASLGLSTALIRYRGSSEREFVALARGSLVLALSVAVALAGAVALSFSVLPEYSIPDIAIPAWSLIPAVVLTLGCVLLDALATAERQARLVFLRNVIANSAKLALLAFVVTTARASVVTTLLAVAISALVVLRLTPAVRRPFTYGPVLLPAGYLRYSGSQYVVAWLMNTPNYLFPLIVVARFGPASGGYFVIAWTTAYLLSAIGDAAAASFLTEASRDPSAVNALYRRILRVFGVATLVAASIGVLAAPLLSVVFGARFGGASVGSFRLLALGAVPYFAVTIIIQRFRVQGGNTRAMLVALVSGPLSCVGIVPLVPVAGQSAAGWSYLIVNCLAALGGWVLLRTSPTPPLVASKGTARNAAMVATE